MSEQTNQSPLKVRCPFCRTKLDMSDLPAFSQINCPKCTAEMTVPQWFRQILLEDVLDTRPGLQVFRALDPALDREACVKLMHSADAAECPLPDASSPYQQEHLDAFLENFRKMSLLVHPGIVPVCSCSAIDGAVYGVTQYISSTPLNQPPTPGLPAWPLLLKHTRTAIEALHYAAKHVLSHGHLTPANLLIDQDGNLFITDFMIAFTIGKNIVSEPWTAPEMATGQEPTCKSDLFSLGVCLYEYATGSLPCAGQQEEWRAGKLRPKHPSQLNPNLPEKFSGILLRMLALDPDDRPSGYASLKDEFDQFGKGSGRSWQRKRPQARKILLPKSARNLRTPLLGYRKRKKGGLLNFIIICLILICLLFAGILILRKKSVQDKLHAIGLLKNGKLNLQVVPDMKVPAEQAGKPEGEESILETEHDNAPSGLLLPPELVASRPRPADYNFKAVHEQISAYLATVPPEILELEKERIRYIGSYKTYLLSKISKMAYSPTNPAGIRLKSGEQVSGNVTMFSNENVLKVRINKGNSSSMREIPWEALPPSQLLEMAYSYVARSAEEIKGARAISRKRLEEVFDEFFYLILLADWYQETDSVKKFCQEAEALPMTGVKEKLSQYILWPD
ncbi:MAG: protein kinase [Lentisphaerae bacterium]|nr:protein kinase [Lentisphaerota bacterium]